MKLFLFLCSNVQYIVPLLIDFYKWVQEQENSDDPHVEFKNFIEAARNGFRYKDPSMLERFFKRV